MAFCGPDLHRFAILEPDGEVFDQRALPGERLGRHQQPLRRAALRRGENLFGRDVGVENAAVQVGFGGARENPVRNQADPEVCAVGGAVFERGQPERIELFATAADGGVVRVPVCHGVTVGARGAQDGLP
ncbi:hypothetical protein SDC9_181975 [bioreactor metagenome]|uniref:Uncharacterized protein n=1 Tax=bioreactor metagenome TaxID=1076179 RepID=A0A645H627_9ZZZZ